jgi:folate-binding protein YgfZ
MMKSASDQAHALATSVGLRRRGDLELVHVRGDDRVSWLNGQITNDVREMTRGIGVYALAVTVRGKIMADVWALDRGDELALLLPASARAVVLESFERQIIMEDVELTTDPSLRVISVQGPRALELTSELDLEMHVCDELGAGGVFVLVDETALAEAWQRLLTFAERLGGCEVDQAGFELARLRAGRARFGSDFSDQNYPQEAGLKNLAVSFNKGCYLGQEVVCTLENRGRLSRALVRLQGDPALPLASGTELRDAQDHAIGHVTSTAFDAEQNAWLALAYVKAAHAAIDARVRAGDSELQVTAKLGSD